MTMMTKDDPSQHPLRLLITKVLESEYNNVFIKFDDTEQSAKFLYFADVRKDISNVQAQLKKYIRIHPNTCIIIGLDFNEEVPTDLIKIVPAILAISLHPKCSFTVLSKTKRPKVECTHILDISSLILKPLNNAISINEQDFLYHVQTSGTTTEDNGGGSKIISVTLDALWPNVCDFMNLFELNEHSTVFSAAPPSFDPFYLDVITAFVSKASLLLTSPVVKMKSGGKLSSMLELHGVTFCQMTPTLFKGLAWCPKSLKHVLLGGEPFPNAQEINHLITTKLHQTRIYNIYGLTEMSVWQSLYEIKNIYSQRQPIVSLKSNLLSETEIYLSDDNEICVKSKKRACFYLGRFHDLIRTGDMGYQIEGDIFFKGRLDDMIKIHGQRMSLTDIEQEWSRVFASPSFAYFVNQRLYALIHANLQVDHLWQQARQKMSPRLFPLRMQTFNSSIPQTAHGKIDKKKLKLLLTLCQDEQEKTEEDLKCHWFRLTGQAPSSGSNFIQDGGDSYTAVLLAEIFRTSDINDEEGSFISTILSGTFQNVLQCVLKRQPCHLETTIHHPSFSATAKESPSIKNKEILKQVWKTDLKKCIDASPIVIGTIVVVGSHKGLIAAYDATSGCTLWEAYLDNRIEATAVASLDKESVFVGTHGCSFYKLSINSGTVLWKNNDATDIIKAIAFVNADFVCFGAYDGCLRKLTILNGQMLWKVDVSAPIIASIQSDNEEKHVFCATLAGNVCKVDFQSGRIIWKVALDSPIFSNFVITGFHLLVCTVKGKVFSISTDNGDVLWNTSVTGHVFASLTLSSNKIILSTKEGLISCIDSRSGQALWAHHQWLESVNAGAVKLSNENIFLIDVQAQYVIVDLHQGLLLQHGSLENIGQTFSSPVLFNNKIIIGSRDDFLYCFALKMKELSL